MSNPNKKAGAASIAELIGDDPIGFALTVLVPPTAAIEKGMPLPEAIALAKNRDAIRAVDEIVLHLVLRMICREKIDRREQLLIVEWILRQLELKRRKKGHPRDYAKELAVYAAYRLKLKAGPEDQQKAIVGELEDEFDLGDRQVRNIIKKIGSQFPYDDKEPALTRTLTAIFRRPKNKR
jgi:hypothetical protein